MQDDISFFVQAAHNVGGVTTWSFQMVKRLAQEFNTRIVAIGSDDALNHLVHEATIRATNISAPAMVIMAETNFWTGRRRTVRRRQPMVSAELSEPTRKILEQTLVYVPNYIEYGYRLAAIAKAEGRKCFCIGVCHTDEPHYYRLLKTYETTIDIFAAVSWRCLRTLQSILPHRQREMIYMPCGVEQPMSSDHCISSDSGVRLLYSGRFSARQKRIFDLLELAKLLTSMRTNYTFDLIGDGPDKSVFISELKKLKSVSSSVQVKPALPPKVMMDLYKNYDVFVLASEFEGTSVAMMEAMVNGVVPVVTKVSGSEDLIRNGENGILVEIGDIETMAKHISMLADNKALLTKLAAAARESIHGIYLVEKGAELFSRMTKQLSQGHSSEQVATIWTSGNN